MRHTPAPCERRWKQPQSNTTLTAADDPYVFSPPRIHLVSTSSPLTLHLVSPHSPLTLSSSPRFPPVFPGSPPVLPRFSPASPRFSPASPRFFPASLFDVLVAKGRPDGIRLVEEYLNVFSHAIPPFVGDGHDVFF